MSVRTWRDRAKARTIGWLQSIPVDFMASISTCSCMLCPFTPVDLCTWLYHLRIKQKVAAIYSSSGCHTVAVSK